MSDELTKRVLVIEDSPSKWRDIEKVLLATETPKISLERAATMEAANEKIDLGAADLILLDISMDIRASGAGPRAGGHDATGGLRIAERMFYLGHDIPVVIVTAFDYFPLGMERGNAALGLGDVLRDASELLGDLLLGCVRYGEAGWETDLQQYIVGNIS